MNRTKNVYALVVLTAGIFFLNSCKKETIVKDKAEQTAASQKITLAATENMNTTTVAQNIMIGIIDYGSQHFKTEGDGLLAGFACATVTKDTVSSPRTATVDFGSGCTNAAGRFMSGSVTVEYLDRDFTTPGNYFKATFTDFVSDSINVSGTMQLTYLGYQLSGTETVSMETNLQTTIDIDRDNLKFTGRNSFTIEIIEDTVSNELNLKFTGSGSGQTSDGASFTQSISTPLEINSICSEHFTIGSLLIQSPGLPDKEIDYGNGTCDNIATVTENGSSYDITLE